MDAASVVRLKPLLCAELGTFAELLKKKATKGSIYSSVHLMAIDRMCSALLHGLSDLERLATYDVQATRTPHKLMDPSVNHFGAVLELGISGISMLFLEVRKELEKTTGESQKAKFWTSKVKFKWDESKLHDLYEQIQEIQAVLQMCYRTLLNEPFHFNSADPMARVQAQLLYNNANISAMATRAHAFRMEVLSDHEKHPLLLSTSEYHKAWIKVKKATADLKNPINVQVNTKSKDPTKPPGPHGQSLSANQTPTVSTPTQSVASSSKQPIVQTSILSISTKIETPAPEEQGQISPTDVEFYDIPTTSVKITESTDLKEIPTEAVNEKADKILKNAASYGQTSIIKMMLKKGANIITDLPLTESPMFAAGINGHLDTLEFICDEVFRKDPHGVLASNAEGDTLLHVACAGRGTLDMVDHVITHRGINVEQSGAKGWRAIHYAAAKNDAALVNHLIVKHGASPNAVCNEMYSPLHIAANRGHIDIIKILLDHGADINVWNIEDDQPIHSAALENRKEIVELLLERGACIDDTDNGTKPWTPIYCAIKSQKMDTLRFLLDKGVDPTGNTKGDQPIHWAAEKGTIDQVSILLACPGIAVDAVSDVNDAGLLPIHHAAFSGNLLTMKYLVSLGADVNCKGSLGTTLLDIAARWGHLNTIQYLIEAGADVNLAGEKGIPTLLTAAIHKRFEIVKALLDAGADPKAVTAKTEYLAIHYAASGGDIPTTLLLLDVYPESIDMTCSGDGKNNLTPLGMAACAQSLDLVTALAARGADFQCITGDALPIIHIASRNNIPDLVHTLKALGADLNHFHEGWTPLMVAGEYSSVNAMRALIECGADIEMVETGDNKGRAIHYAAAMKNHKPVECLVEKGADIEATMQGGLRPLHLAAKYGHVETLKTLMRLGAKVDAVDDEGRSALDIAVVSGMVGAVECLI